MALTWPWLVFLALSAGSLLSACVAAFAAGVVDNVSIEETGTVEEFAPVPSGRDMNGVLKVRTHIGELTLLVPQNPTIALKFGDQVRVVYRQSSRQLIQMDLLTSASPKRILDYEAPVQAVVLAGLVSLLLGLAALAFCASILRSGTLKRYVAER
jgi:hypothetical protein